MTKFFTQLSGAEGSIGEPTFGLCGDALGTACAVLMLLGPGARQFVGCEVDSIFGWIGVSDESWGDVLVLEVQSTPSPGWMRLESRPRRLPSV